MASEEQTDFGASVQVQASLVPKLNLALYQNSVPVLRELAILNDGEGQMQAVELTLSASPPFVKPKTWRIDLIGPQQHYHLTDLDVVMDGPLLGRLTEAENALITFMVFVGQKEICRLELPIELLPRNQWGGIGHMPELVASFVQPNDPAIDRLLKKAAAVLRQHGKNGALNGYKEGAQHAWEMASAVWTAIGGLGLDYALPPASFEHTGQKVRSPGQITDSGLATCLDTTTLFCAALEQCGLNPLVVVTKGHAFTGVWLKEEVFSTVIVDDVTALRKRAKLNELALFETTLVTHRPYPGFSYAIERGIQQISEAQDDAFELAVDIRRARLQRIKPLASAEVVLPVVSPMVMEMVEPVFEMAPADLTNEEIRRPESDEPGKSEDRLDRWQRKLLDLSLRNSLLNFRATRKAITLEAPDAGRLEDVLADGHALKLLPRPDLMEGVDSRSRTIHEARTGEDLLGAVAREALLRKEVFVGLQKDELEVRLVDLFRSARLTLQEGGANTLFLALGFLSWSRDDKEVRRYRAPLILVPVTLLRKSVRSGFSLVLHDEEPRFNPALLEMLRQDFYLVLPVADGDLPKDDHGLDVAGIWKSVALAIKEIRGWEVVEEVVLATFSFAKHLMWKDLVDRTDQLKQNPVVRHLIETPRDPYPSTTPFPNPRELDTTCSPEKTFCPLPADSSQLAAVMAAVTGKDFVLVGPPGTGKSQTIANLIGQCLADGKSVLFVSEKMAALNVVYRRLRDVGMGEFCLEMHSSKANKLHVLDQLRMAWDARGDIDTQEWHREAHRLKSLRNQLNLFVTRLHHKHYNGLAAYGAIGRVLTGHHIPIVKLSWPSVNAHDMDKLDALRELASRLEVNAGEIGTFADSPLAVIHQGEWSPNWQQSFLQEARDGVLLAEVVQKHAVAFCQAVGLPNLKLTERTRKGLAILARTLSTAFGHDWRFVLRPDSPRLIEALQQGCKLIVQYRQIASQLSTPLPEDVMGGMSRGLDLLTRHGDVVSQLSVPYRNEVYGLDARQLQADLAKAERSWWPWRWLRRRRVHAALTAFVDGQHEPDVVADISRLVTLGELESEIQALDPLIAKVDDLWQGLEPQIEPLKAALAFQGVLAAVFAGDSWQEEGLTAVADGRCGAHMATDLKRITKLRTLKKDIADFDHLQDKTDAMWRGLNSPLEEIAQVVTFHKQLVSAITDIATTPDIVAEVKSVLHRLLWDGNALLEPSGVVNSRGNSYCDHLAQYQQTVHLFTDLARISSENLTSMVGDTPAEMAEACDNILKLTPKLRAWCAWRKVRGEALIHGLSSLVEAIESGVVVPNGVTEAFEVNYCRWWLNAAVDHDDVLRGFVSAEHEKRITDFKVLDDRFTNLSRAYVRAKLCASLPNQNIVAKNSEWGLLRYEMQKKRRHLPLREMFNRLPTAIPKLTPCLLMSPLSIAQYLPANTALFDVVVFDEASQIPVWDAIGAIARGKQVIMVGDPKQLPPTSFFDRAESESDAEDVEGDLESILDECLGANLPAHHLSWHYRSRHESLIAFSNARYYGGGLVTFPSPVTEDRAVRFHHVHDGVYEKGGARINKPEARALVADIATRLKDEKFISSRLTIGVVTFNAEQQRLIEDLLDEERRKTPAIERFFGEEVLEPLFVKNLESVQGDERDIIYFSITYGPDRTGVLSMNFGPMNRSGGERRLNVAITRARHELIVFSSIKHEQIDLSRTQSDGVGDLKRYLEFAERGPRGLAEAVAGTIGDYDSHFEKAVAEALSGKGWRVHPQVGVSSFRIDLGVVDPDAPGRYLAGVECDGATYHRSATARDRDKLREQILRGLGWEILRIWSTDWWVNAPEALEKVHSRLESLLATSRERRAEEAKRFTDVAPPPTEEGEGETLANDAIDASPCDDTGSRDVAMFHEADPASVVSSVNPAVFFDAAYDVSLQAMIAHIVEKEGPVRGDVLAKRIARAHGWARTGTRILDRVTQLANKKPFLVTKEDIGSFLWPVGNDGDHWPTFRRPATNKARPVDEIALPELIALANELILKGYDGEEAISNMAREAGLQQLRIKSRERLELAWRIAKNK